MQVSRMDQKACQKFGTDPDKLPSGVGVEVAHLSLVRVSTSMVFV